MGNLKGEYKHRKNLEWSTKGLHSRVKSLVSKNPCKLLDVGAGTGNLANLFYNEGYDVTVVDIENFLINKNYNYQLSSDNVNSDSAVPGYKELFYYLDVFGLVYF